MNVGLSKYHIFFTLQAHQADRQRVNSFLSILRACEYRIDVATWASFTGSCM